MKLFEIRKPLLQRIFDSITKDYAFGKQVWVWMMYRGFKDDQPPARWEVTGMRQTADGLELMLSGPGSNIGMYNISNDDVDKWTIRPHENGYHFYLEKMDD